MKTIWKFPLQIVDVQTVLAPGGAGTLAVAEQSGRLCLWAVVDPQEFQRPIEIRIVGTGHEMFDADRLSYIGTVPMSNGLVWHVFRRQTRDEANRLAEAMKAVTFT